MIADTGTKVILPEPAPKKVILSFPRKFLEDDLRVTVVPTEPPRSHTPDAL